MASLWASRLALLLVFSASGNATAQQAVYDYQNAVINTNIEQYMAEVEQHLEQKLQTILNSTGYIHYDTSEMRLSLAGMSSGALDRNTLLQEMRDSGEAMEILAQEANPHLVEIKDSTEEGNVIAQDGNNKLQTLVSNSYKADFKRAAGNSFLGQIKDKTEAGNVIASSASSNSSTYYQQDSDRSQEQIALLEHITENTQGYYEDPETDFSTSEVFSPAVDNYTPSEQLVAIAPGLNIVLPGESAVIFQLPHIGYVEIPEMPATFSNIIRWTTNTLLIIAVFVISLKLIRGAL